METQTYANHRHRPRLWTTGAVAAIVALGLVAWVTISAPTLPNVALLLLAYAAAVAVYNVRQFALKLQDRIIRLEMRLRLASVLPDDQHAHISALTPRQLVGLRFASDPELPMLGNKVVSGELKDPRSIKKAVQNWEADHFRA